MKKIKWGECKLVGGSTTKTGQAIQLSFDAPVTEGLHVTTRYENTDVHLRIIKELSPNVFSASVLYFEPVNSPKPININIDDTVEVDVSDICWRYNK